jgi:hypothetical protein
MRFIGFVGSDTVTATRAHSSGQYVGLLFIVQAALLTVTGNSNYLSSFRQHYYNTCCSYAATTQAMIIALVCTIVRLTMNSTQMVYAHDFLALTPCNMATCCKLCVHAKPTEFSLLLAHTPGNDHDLLQLYPVPLLCITSAVCMFAVLKLLQKRPLHEWQLHEWQSPPVLTWLTAVIHIGKTAYSLDI